MKYMCIVGLYTNGCSSYVSRTLIMKIIMMTAMIMSKTTL
jgi:hypothetical protein